MTRVVLDTLSYISSKHKPWPPTESSLAGNHGYFLN